MGRNQSSLVEPSMAADDLFFQLLRQTQRKGCCPWDPPHTVDVTSLCSTLGLRWRQLRLRAVTNSPCLHQSRDPDKPSSSLAYSEANRTTQPPESLQTNLTPNDGEERESQPQLHKHVQQTLPAPGPGLKPFLGPIFPVNRHHKLKAIFFIAWRTERGYLWCNVAHQWVTRKVTWLLLGCQQWCQSSMTIKEHRSPAHPSHLLLAFPHDTSDPFLLKEILHRVVAQACHLAYKEADRQF